MPQAPGAAQGGSGGVVHARFGVQSNWLSAAVFPPPSVASGALIPYTALRLAVFFSTTPPPIKAMPSPKALPLSLLTLHQRRALTSPTTMPVLTLPVTTLRRTCAPPGESFANWSLIPSQHPMTEFLATMALLVYPVIQMPVGIPLAPSAHSTR